MSSTSGRKRSRTKSTLRLLRTQEKRSTTRTPLEALHSKVHELLAALQPLPGLVFITRCAMRERPLILPASDKEFFETLIEYDSWIRDTAVLCLLVRSWEDKRALLRNIATNEETTVRQRPGVLHTGFF